jgi:hypothetical protein
MTESEKKARSLVGALGEDERKLGVLEKLARQATTNGDLTTVAEEARSVLAMATGRVQDLSEVLRDEPSIEVALVAADGARSLGRSRRLADAIGAVVLERGRNLVRQAAEAARRGAPGSPCGPAFVPDFDELHTADEIREHGEGGGR